MGLGKNSGCYLSWLTVWLSLSISDKLVTMLATTALHGRQAGDHWSCPCLSIRLGTLCLQPDTEKIDAFKSSGADRGNMKEGPHSYVSYLQIKAFLIVWSMTRLQAQPCILYCVAALSGVWCCTHHSPPVTMCGNNQHMIRLQWRFSITSDTARYFTQSKSLFHIPSSKNSLVAGGPVAGGGDKARVLLCKWVIPLSSWRRNVVKLLAAGLCPPAPFRAANNS